MYINVRATKMFYDAKGTKKILEEKAKCHRHRKTPRNRLGGKFDQWPN